jgi:hypothetical protein
LAILIITLTINNSPKGTIAQTRSLPVLNNILLLLESTSNLIAMKAKHNIAAK